LVTSFADANCKSRAEAQKKLVDELKVQWKLLWSERFDDKERAEGVSVNDYAILLVERGTVIHATRDCKALIFREILEKQVVENPERFIAPDVNTGGWNKFIKTEITSNMPRRCKRVADYSSENAAKSKSETQQAKKGGRGWLHKS
jgi:hypothetical protein